MMNDSLIMFQGVNNEEKLVLFFVSQVVKLEQMVDIICFSV